MAVVYSAINGLVRTSVLEWLEILANSAAWSLSALFAVCTILVIVLVWSIVRDFAASTVATATVVAIVAIATIMPTVIVFATIRTVIM
ncbi:hypothetical protein, partial [Bifidobacterium sp.]|uniref:hypothetical protein n=1 Tax=Bifidobacterium sp. TaxID=41200 RepID=UPI0039ED670E